MYKMKKPDSIIISIATWWHNLNNSEMLTYHSITLFFIVKIWVLVLVNGQNRNRPVQSEFTSILLLNTVASWESIAEETKKDAIKPHKMNSYNVFVTIYMKKYNTPSLKILYL
jgi:hypothetical protein